jgi:ectoine hydroxylase-related dioxygenase (phytanoyl-CoA dioxygenase family)
LSAAFFARFGAFFRDGEFAGVKAVGNRRLQVPVDFSAPFGSPDLYANPLILPILQALLGPGLFFGIFGSVTSLPGAEDQHLHRDNPLLFGEAINRFLPPYAINLFVPLVEFNAMTGTTRLLPGTHVRTGPEALQHPACDPIVRVGSCLLMDYRLYHQGTANRSETIRPMLFCAYHLPWYKDYWNQKTWPFLRISDADYAAIPAEHRSMFAWIEHYRAGLY